MTDEEFQVFLDWDRSPYAFAQLSAEWKAWAKTVIPNAKVGVGGEAMIQRDDAVLYLCQVMQLFEGLHKGIAEDVIRGKFVSGLVVSGFPPQKDASFFFLRALKDARDRGYTTSKEVDSWRPGMASGSGWESVCELTLAGQRLADSAGIAAPSVLQEQDHESSPGIASSDLKQGTTGCIASENEQQTAPSAHRNDGICSIVVPPAVA